MSGYLLASNNLSDLANIATARTNLDLGAAALLNTNVSLGVPELDANNNLSGQTIGPNLFSCQTVNALDAYSSSALVNYHAINVTNFAFQSDQGGGLFLWNATSAATPDVGVTRCPVDRQTTISNVAVLTGDGSTTVFNFTLAHCPIIPGSVSITIGGVTAVDNSGGEFYGTGVATWKKSTGVTAGSFQSTINYTTGVCKLTLTTAPGSGIVGTANYNYASTAGRWVRQFSGLANIRWFGAYDNNSTDIYPALCATDAYAYSRGTGVYVPSAINGGWKLKTPFVAKAGRWIGDAQIVEQQICTTINFVPSVATDLISGITNYNPCTFENLNVDSSDILPTAATIVSSGWIPATAVMTGTIAGNTLTLTTNATGSIIVGARMNSISGSGMAPQPMGFVQILSLASGTLGASGSTYTISGAAQNISSPITITQTAYPQLSCIKAGTVAWEANNQAQYINCYSQNCKIGLLMSAPGGHVSTWRSIMSGFLGIHCLINQSDYSFWDGAIQGVLAGLSTGYTGCVFRAFRCHVGYSPFGVLQLDDGSTLGNSVGVLGFYGCSFEGFGEAAIQSLPNCNVDFEFRGDVNGNMGYGFGLPTTLVPSQATYFFQMLGTVGRFKTDSASTWTSGSLGVANIGVASSSLNTDLDFDTFGDNFVISSTYSAYEGRDVRWPRQERDYQRRTEKAMVKGFLSQWNLLLNPEVSGNYTTIIGTVTIVPLNTLLAGALAGQVIPRQIYEESGTDDPNVIVISGGASTPSARLNTIALSGGWNVNRSICFNCWALTSASNMRFNFIGPSGTYLYPGGNFVGNSTAFSRAMFLGNKLSDVGATSLIQMEFYGTAAGQTLYIIAPMLSYDDLAPYNPQNLPSSSTGLMIGTNGNSSSITIDQNGNIVENAAIVDIGTKTVVPTTGSSETIPQNCATYFVKPAGTLAALTITLPSAPTTVAASSIPLRIYFAQAITAITITAPSGTTLGGAAIPAGIALGGKLEFTYFESQTEWFHSLGV